jgi:hypothetical protein
MINRVGSHRSVVDRRRLTVALIAVLALLAVGITAATLTSTVSPSGDGGGFGDQNDENGIVPSQNGTGTSQTPQGTPLWLEMVFVVVTVIVLISAFVYLALYRRRAAVFLAALLVVLVLFYLFLQAFFSSGINIPEGSSVGDFAPGMDSGGGEGESETQRDLSNLAIVIFGGVLALLVLAAAIVLRGDDEEEAGDDGEGEGAETEELARIAGEAADRIEDGESSDAEAENEVYRAWREMTEVLDVENRETTTPREFSRQAVDAGIAPDDVRELTDLFEAVRYGGESPTDDREQRALDVLRRIESTYGDAE